VTERACTALIAAALALRIAATPGAATAQTQTMQQACRADYDRLCAGVLPGGGRILACLQSHADKLDPACKEALAKVPAK
jgi:hypothetical protein